jgi:hypothetical protein
LCPITSFCFSLLIQLLRANNKSAILVQKPVLSRIARITARLTAVCVICARQRSDRLIVATNLSEWESRNRTDESESKTRALKKGFA